MNLKFWNSKLIGWTYRHVQRWVYRHDAEVERQYRYDDCVAKFRERLLKNNIPVDKPAPGEDEYIRFWQQFCDGVEPYTYRNFVRIVGENPHIIPEDIGAAYIESILNPLPYRGLYSDKNMFPLLIHPKEILPKTYLCRFDGGKLLDGDYKLAPLYVSTNNTANISASAIADFLGKGHSFVLKLSKEGYGGKGVKKIIFREPFYQDEDGIIIDGNYLHNYSENFVIQEIIQQHPFLSQFCSSSCNTMRLMTYRSVTDESVNIFGAALRVGHEGSFVDNITSGGGRIMIDVASGKLGKIVYDKYARSTSVLNGIDFSKNDFLIPFWSEICKFAEMVGLQIPLCRLISMDITYDTNCKPRLIEINIGGFCWSTTMYAGKIPFGDRFDEVIDYCLKRKKEIDK